MDFDTINDRETMDSNAKPLYAGRYRIVKRLGQGGMGSVWLAEDIQLDNRLCAIKTLPSILVSNKRAYRQLKEEALMSMKLTHSNIVTLRAFEENNGNPFLVMDYVDGETLDDYLGDRGILTEEEVISLLKPIAEALDYAHKEGVVHRDIKPANVMIRKDGHPYILDFGIAREIQETMTRVTGKLSSGTLLYMSPEQLNGESPKAPQDIYSFGAMVYECLNGEPPFVRGQIEHQILHNEPTPLAENITISKYVQASLAKRATDRPTTCLAVLGADERAAREAHAAKEAEAKRKAEEEARRQAQAEREAKEREEKAKQEELRKAAIREAQEKARREALEAVRQRAEEARKQAEIRAQEEARHSKNIKTFWVIVLIIFSIFCGKYVNDYYQEKEQAKQVAVEEAVRKAEEEAKERAEKARKEAEEAERQRAAEEAKRIAAEEAARKAEEEARRKAQAEEEAKERAEKARKEAEEAERQRAAEEAKRIAAEEAARKSEEEARRKAQAEEEAKERAEKARKEAEEAERQRAAEAVRKARADRYKVERDDGYNLSRRDGIRFRSIDQIKEMRKVVDKKYGGVAYYRAAMINLGLAYLYGVPVPRDYSEAMRLFNEAAVLGSSDAQCCIGAMYAEGRGVSQDYAEAVEWFRKSANQGNSYGQYNLGFMYDYGQGVAQDYAEAVKWYRKSANQGNSWGQCYLGFMYAYGFGVDQDYFEAVKWYRKSAEQGNDLGQYYLGFMYENGFGVNQDYSEAAKWYRRVALKGYTCGNMAKERLSKLPNK